MEIRPVAVMLVHADRRTGGTAKPISTFYGGTNAPRNSSEH